MTVDMAVDLAGVRLPNPMMTASGCAANGREMHRFIDVAQLGAFVTKSVKAQPVSGRGTPRMAETPSGMLNSIGLQGPGVQAFVEEDLAWLDSIGARVVVSDLDEAGAERTGQEIIDAGGEALNPRGEIYTRETIQARLGMRNFMEELRSAGVQTGGPAPFNAADKQRFANALDKWLVRGKLS